MEQQTTLKLFTREQVVKIIDEILLNADCVMDAITSEYTDYDGEELLSMVENKQTPDPKLIDSMAMRYRHDFGLLEEPQKESIRSTMKQLWEEVVGLGFYKTNKAKT
jgi:hypothetical protein